jgi:hypothetical protein
MVQLDEDKNLENINNSHIDPWVYEVSSDAMKGIDGGENIKRYAQINPASAS